MTHIHIRKNIILFGSELFGSELFGSELQFLHGAFGSFKEHCPEFFPSDLHEWEGISRWPHTSITRCKRS